MQSIKCLLAVEPESVDIIKTNLEKVYKDEVVFYVCTHADELARWSSLGLEIVILSRFLPRNEKDKEFLMRLGLLFPDAHIIVLAGTESEQRRVFIDLASQCGITDFVTGKLPGDRPFTIFEAINIAKERILDSRGATKERLVWEEESETNGPEKSEWRSSEERHALEPMIETNIEYGNRPRNDLGPSQAAIPSSQWGSTANWGLGQPAQPTLQPAASQIEPALNFAELGCHMGPFNAQPSGVAQPPHFGGDPFTAGPQKGILVVPSANKGGVGKTTAGISLGVVLAKMGVSTVIVDFNFGGPNVHSFFDIKDVPGIEALAHRSIRPNSVADLLVQVRPNLHVLPGPMNKTIPMFEAQQLAEIIGILQQMFSVVICDTPPEFWTKPWLSPIFAMADYILAVVDQSKFSEDETRNFAPYMLAMGAKPESIKIVLNRFDPKLHNPRIVEKAFCAGFKKDVKPLPRVSVVIPNDWVAHVKKSYKGEVAGVDDEKYSQWHKLANEIIKKAGISVRPAEEKSRKSLFGGLFKKKG